MIADSVVAAGDVDFGSLLALVEGDDPGDVDRNTGGVAEYLRTVRAAPEYETFVLPLGEGVSVSVRLERDRR